MGRVVTESPVPPNVRHTRRSWVKTLDVRAVPGYVLGLFILERTAALVAINGWFFGLPGLPLAGALLSPTLLGNLASLPTLLLVILIIGRARPADVGLRVTSMVPGIAFTVATWIVAFVILTAAGGQAATRVGAVTIGVFIGQILGNAIVEEIAYRGFLLPQLFAISRGNRIARLALALLGSQLVFAALHAPGLLLLGMEPATFVVEALTGLLPVGLFLAGIYLATGSLFAAVGVHALMNAPFGLPATGLDPKIAVGLGTLVCLAASVTSRSALFGRVGLRRGQDAR